MYDAKGCKIKKEELKNIITINKEKFNFQLFKSYDININY